MPPRIYETSKRLGPISHDQLSRALTRFELGDLLTVKPVPLGLFGQNLFVTSSAGEFVFRGAPPEIGRASCRERVFSSV